jgi:cytochrome b561
LQLHTQLLTYQRLVAAPEEFPVESEEQTQARRHKMLYRIFIATTMIGVLLLVTGGIESFYLWIVGLSLMVGGIVGTTLCTEAPFLFYRRKFPMTSTDLKPSQTRELPRTDPIAKLPDGLPEPLTSITEQTTEKLFEKAPARGDRM